MKAICLVFGFMLISGMALCQNKETGEEVLVLNGTYQGKNLFVQNPILEGGFCATRVSVNGKEISVVIDASAFEIRLDKLGVKEGEKLEIRIFHHQGCKPRILNPIVH